MVHQTVFVRAHVTRLEERACAHAYVHSLYSMKDKAGHYTIAQLSIKPAMLVSSVHPVVACYATAPRVCTLVLFRVVGLSLKRFPYIKLSNERYLRITSGCSHYSKAVHRLSV